MLSPGITFLNRPWLSEHSIDRKHNKKRLLLVSYIQKYLATNKIFKNDFIRVSFFHLGMSSLVTLIKTKKRKYVLKIILREHQRRQARFLNAWKNVGVSVPRIYETGKIMNLPYILMEFVDAETLNKTPKKKLLKMKTFKRMGKILQKIHKSSSRGYGLPIKENTGKYKKFKNWLLKNPTLKEQFAYVREHKLLPYNVYGSLDEAIAVLIDYVGKNQKSTYCHWDFSPGNIFNTKNLTTFDPATNFNHPYLDLAKSVVQTFATLPSFEATDQIIEGYFENNKLLFDPKVLQAGVLLTCHMKFLYWHKTKAKNRINNLKKYLLANKAYLKT